MVCIHRPVFSFPSTMKRALFVIVPLCCVYLSLLLFSFSPKETATTPEAQVQEQFMADLEQLLDDCYSLSNLAISFPESTSSVVLQYQLLETRLAFKRVAFLLDYYDPQAVKDHVNGAPLPSLERKVPSLVVLEPEGLQILDELIFSDDPNSEAELIRTLTQTLAKNVELLRNTQLSTKVYDRHVFEGVQLELIRLFTLGLTGFDTPGSVNAIPEARQALEAMTRALQPYTVSLHEQGKKDLASELTQSLMSPANYLEQHTDFDSFDRLTFLREQLNPLYQAVLKSQRALGVETIYETSTLVHPLNYNSTGLFSNDILNPYAFTQLSEKQDNHALRLLGKTLFFDPVLSRNNKRSCASCHNPQKGFTDGVAKSMAMDFEGTVNRNAPTVVNSVYADRYFHDLRAQSLELQAEHVIYSDKEFDTHYAEILEKLQQSDSYMAMFREAYPGWEDPISKPTLTGALESYVLSLRGFNSPFDQYVRKESDQLSASAKRGFNLFMGKAACGTCHFAPTFNGLVPPHFEESESEVLGVPASIDTLNPELDPDWGRIGSGIIKEESEIYAHSFKTPTVRNIALTAPYMHNGVYNTLQEVMAFYNKGGGAGLGLDVPNQTLPGDPLGLTQQEMDDIISFMESLTDTTGMCAKPVTLPEFEARTDWNSRLVGGEY